MSYLMTLAYCVHGILPIELSRAQKVWIKSTIQAVDQVIYDHFLAEEIDLGKKRR